MSDETTIAVTETNLNQVTITSLDEMARMRNAIVAFHKNVLKRDVDYGTIEGTSSPVLFKPGMQKLNSLFQLVPRYTIERDVDHETSWYEFTVECELSTRNSVSISTGWGSANSWESKYRFRWVSLADVPPDVDLDHCLKREGTISEFGFAIDKAETTGKYGKPAEYWQEFKRAIKDGTARQFQKATRSGREYLAWEIESVVYRVTNPNIHDQINTLLKMAQKRALAEATLNAHAISEFYTVDLDDWALDGDYVEGEFSETDKKDKTPAHWIDRDDAQRAFWSMAIGTLNLTSEDALKALGDVERVRDFTGTMAEAKVLLEAYAAAQQKQKPGTLDVALADAGAEEE